jgi:hypothetical protein
METYEFSVTLHSGDDEYWEALDRMPLDVRLEEIKSWTYFVSYDKMF